MDAEETPSGWSELLRQRLSVIEQLSFRRELVGVGVDIIIHLFFFRIMCQDCAEDISSIILFHSVIILRGRHCC